MNERIKAAMHEIGVMTRAEKLSMDSAYSVMAMLVSIAAEFAKIEAQYTSDIFMLEAELYLAKKERQDNAAH